MQQLPDKPLAHNHSPLTQPPCGEQTNASQPAASRGNLALRRPLATASDSDRPALLVTSSKVSPPGSRDITDTPSLAQHLPALVLHKIFTCLPSWCLSQCARVCRHWHACLPRLETRIARWQQENAPLSYLVDSHLGRSFRSRTQPFLQEARSVFLPPLMQLRQQQLSGKPDEARQDTQPQLSAACDLLSPLVYAALHRQLTQAPQLRLHPLTLDWPKAVMPELCTFSPCSRWLAVSCSPPADGSAALRLYGWEQGTWQRCVLVPDIAGPAKFLRFCSVPPDTLLCVHDVEILAWSLGADLKTWYGTLVCRMPPSYQIFSLHPVADGDLLVMVKGVREDIPFLHMVFCRSTGDGRWTTVMTHNSRAEEGTQDFFSWTVDPQSCQLALKRTRQQQDAGHLLNKLHIWHKGLASSRPAPWECQTTVLPGHDVALKDLAYSPGGHYLLGVFSDGRACLWQRDAQYRLQEQLTVPGCWYNPERELGWQTPFRRDGKQLALCLSLSQVQLFYCDTDGRWQYGPLLETPPVTNVLANDRLKNMRLSSSGRILARQTEWRLDIWHQDPVEGWQHFVQHTKKLSHKYFPQFCLLQPGELVCTSTEDPGLSLSIYGPDSRGRLVRKTSMPIKVCINGPNAASPDGLSLLLGASRSPVIALQLVASEDNDAEACRLL